MGVITPHLLFLLDSPNIASGYALAGTPARVLALADNCRRSGAVVTLVLCDRGGDYGTAPDWPVDVVLVHPADYYDPAALARVCAADIDIVVVCEAQALIAVGRPLADQVHARLLYDVHDDDAALARSLLEPPSAVARAFDVQQRALHTADVVIACAQRELVLALGSNIPADRVALFPNGADSGSMCWGPVCSTERLVFVGNLFYRPNQIAVEHLRTRILPRLPALCPRARVQVIGHGPAHLIQPCVGLEFCGPAVSIESALRGATLGLAPLTAGAGSKMKVLDYLAAGLPVLATSEAVTGLPPGHPGVVVDDDLDGWAARIATLLGNPARLRELGWAGRDALEEHLSWRQIAAGLVRRCRDWIALPQRRGPTAVAGPIDVARWQAEHAAQGALGAPRHTMPGHPVRLVPTAIGGASR